MNIGAVIDRLTWLTLLVYVATVPLASVALANELSMSFLTAILFFGCKLASALFFRRPIHLGPAVLTMGLLLAYLVGREAVSDAPLLDRAYFGAFVLNYVMFVAMLDEFKRRPALAGHAVLVFSASVAAISTLTQIGWGSATSQSDRVTFLGINENEMALSCLVAFTGTSLKLHSQTAKGRWSYLALFLISVILVLALVSTGTRFALLVLISHLVLLLGYLFVFERGSTTRIVTNVSLLVLTLAATGSSQMMINRLDPSMGAGRSDSGNVLELGGRLSLWRDAKEAFLQSPLFGLGHGGYRQFQVEMGRSMSLPHNLLMEVAVIGGVVGLCLLLVLLIRMTSHVHRIYTGPLSIVLAGLPLMAAVSFLNIGSIKTVWFYLAVFLVGDLASKLKNRGVVDAGAASQLDRMQ